MHRIDHSTAVSDLHGAGKPGYTAGSPSTGVPATVVTADALNALQEEIARLVEGAGLTLNKADNAQALAAVQALIAGAAAGLALPSGTVLAFARNTAPVGWLKANGAAVSRATYAALFAAIGTTFGAGDGSTTFNVPDLRGEFLRGWDDGRGADPGRAFGSAQADELKSHAHTVGLQNTGGGLDYSNPDTGSLTSGTNAGTTAATGGAETRPRNVALLFCIKF